jgi:ABC-2 type transport system permease protein
MFESSRYGWSTSSPNWSVLSMPINPRVGRRPVRGTPQPTGAGFLVRSVVESAIVQLRMFRSSTVLVLGAVQPVAFLSIALLLPGQAGTSVTELAIRTGLLSIWSTAIWQAGYVLKSERAQGVLAAIVASPANIVAVLVGKCVGAMIRGSTIVAVATVAISLLIGHEFRIVNVPGFLLALVASLLSAAVLGVLLSPLFILTRAADRIAETLMYPVFIVGGLLIPVGLLPGWAQDLSVLVSLRHGAALVLAAVEGRPQAISDWLLLAGSSTLYGLVGVVLISVVLRRGRQEGTLDFY